jgi:hypothetical protein
MPNVPQVFPKQWPICAICHKPANLATALIDQHGNTVHEECYVLKLRQEDAKKPPKAS